MLIALEILDPEKYFPLQVVPDGVPEEAEARPARARRENGMRASIFVRRRRTHVHNADASWSFYMHDLGTHVLISPFSIRI